MTRIDRLHIEATIAALDALSFLVGGGTAADGLRAHRVALRQALDADPAPAVVNPYPAVSGISAIFRHDPNIQMQQQYNPEPSYPDWVPRGTSREKRMREINQGTYRFPAETPLPDPQQYDAEAPKDPT